MADDETDGGEDARTRMRWVLVCVVVALGAGVALDVVHAAMAWLPTPAPAAIQAAFSVPLELVEWVGVGALAVLVALVRVRAPGLSPLALAAWLLVAERVVITTVGIGVFVASIGFLDKANPMVVGAIAVGALSAALPSLRSFLLDGCIVLGGVAGLVTGPSWRARAAGGLVALIGLVLLAVDVGLVALGFLLSDAFTPRWH